MSKKAFCDSFPSFKVQYDISESRALFDTDDSTAVGLEQLIVTLCFLKASLQLVGAVCIDRDGLGEPSRRASCMESCWNSPYIGNR